MENNIYTPPFPTGKKELRLCLAIGILAVLLMDFWIYGGLNLGFSLSCAGLIIASAVYLLRNGCRLNGYSGALLALCLVLCASFVRSDDGFVKFVTLCFLLLSYNLGLCLLAGRNRRSPAGVASLLDSFRALFYLGFGKLSLSMGGLNEARKNSGTAGKKHMDVVIGLLVAIPLVAVLICLLISADAAFEGLLSPLLRINFSEPLYALILSLPLACWLYTRTVALKHTPKPEAAVYAAKGIHALTMNTALGAVCVVYVVYLFSQLAYFVGGFSGILPENYTMAEYARRGFFEMAWLSAINLAVMTLAAGLVARKQNRAPLTTRCMCLFIGLVTLFFVVTASAKMLMYINSYGLTRLRVLTEVIMVFIGLTTIFVSLWLFLPKFAYMKAVLLTALTIGAAVAWADVDTVVAAYNVSAYQSGRLGTVDVSYLARLSDGVVPFLAELAQGEDPLLADQARQALYRHSCSEVEDFRSVNIASVIAHTYEKYFPDPVDDTEYASVT